MPLTVDLFVACTCVVPRLTYLCLITFLYSLLHTCYLIHTNTHTSGSSHLQLGLCSTPMHGRGFFGSYPDAVLPGLHVVEGGQTSTGSVVRWLSRALVPEHAWPGFEVLNAAAAALPPGAEGLLCCEHFQVRRHFSLAMCLPSLTHSGPYMS